MALIVVNTTCHAKMMLSNVWMIFLPPNMTAGTQPLDAGIMKNFKMKYRQYLLDHLIRRMDIDNVESVEELTKKVDVKQAIDWLAKARGDVTAETISNCFAAVGIGNKIVVDNDTDVNLLTRTMHVLGLEEPQLEENPVTTAPLNESDNWEDKILKGLDKIKDKEVEEECEDESSENNEEERETELVRNPNFTEVTAAFETIKLYLVANDIDSNIEDIEKQITRKRINHLKDGSIRRFFK